MDKSGIKQALEAMLFVWGTPLPAKTAAQVLGVPPGEVYDAADELAQDYKDRGSGLNVRRINNSYQLCTRPECEEYIAALCTPVKKKRLSNAAMEVLTIIAYSQPVSKPEIEHIRGIKCGTVLEGLQSKNLIEEKGRGEGLGRPILYGTTDYFLEKFGISSLDELPVPDIEDDEYDKLPASMIIPQDRDKQN